MSDVTVLLEQAHAGDTSALDRLFPLVYDELRALARARRRGGAAETLNTTALVHEAYEKMAGGGRTPTNRLHFFRVASRVMRSVLVDYARAQRTARRGGDLTRAPLAAVPDPGALRVDEVLAVDDALGRLEALDERQARVVECRYFVGLTVDETAGLLDVSPSTVHRDWAAARAWLARELAG